jgi:hypothetical protein
VPASTLKSAAAEATTGTTGISVTAVTRGHGGPSRRCAAFSVAVISADA